MGPVFTCALGVWFSSKTMWVFTSRSSSYVVFLTESVVNTNPKVIRKRGFRVVHVGASWV